MKINMYLGHEPLWHKEDLSRTSHCKKVEAALLEVNGTATAHTYSGAHEIKSLVQWAEAMLGEMYIPKKARAGIKLYATSGNPVESGFQRQATRVRLLRGPNSWFITDIQMVAVGKRGGGKHFVLSNTHKVAILSGMGREFNFR